MVQTPPRIAGDGAQGWDAIRQEINLTEDGGALTIIMNDASSVPQAVLDALRGKDVDVTFHLSNGVSWSINGMDISAPADTDLGVQLDTGHIPGSVTGSITGEKATVQITLDASGSLGFDATLKLNLGAANAGYYASLYYYNPPERRAGVRRFRPYRQRRERGVRPQPCLGLRGSPSALRLPARSRIRPEWRPPQPPTAG